MQQPLRDWYWGKLLWGYRAVFKQTNAGGGAVKIRITVEGRSIILYGAIGPNDYAADRTITATIQDADDEILSYVAFPAPVDNEIVPLVAPNGVAAVIDTQASDFSQVIVLGDTDQLVIDVATLVQNEEVDLGVRGYCQANVPNVTTTGSGGTVTTTEAYDRVL